MQSGYSDQAAGLRRLVTPRPVKVIAVASGKGGVGKTNVSINLATSLAQNGRQVMLLDADMGLANIDVLLGLQPLYNLSHVFNGECSLEDIILTGPSGLRLVPGASGIKQMANLHPEQYAGLVHAFGEIGQSFDVLVVDLPAGIAEGVTTLSQASQEVIVVVCDEPASITDAYALIKVLSRDHGIGRFRVLANMTQSLREGQMLFHKLAAVSNRFLDVTLDYLGAVPSDEYLRKAVQKQRAVVEAFPGSRSTKAFKNLAQTVDKWPVESTASGGLQFFVEQLVGGSAARRVSS